MISAAFTLRRRSAHNVAERPPNGNPAQDLRDVDRLDLAAGQEVRLAREHLLRARRVHLRDLLHPAGSAEEDVAHEALVCVALLVHNEEAVMYASAKVEIYYYEKQAHP